MSTTTVTTCTYNAGNAGSDKVTADLRSLIGLFIIVCLQEVADRARELAATGARVLQLDGKDRGHVAMLLQNSVQVLSWGYEQCTRRSFVGAWGAGPRVIAAKWILWALVDVGDGATLTAADTHMVPSVQRKATGPIARLGLRRRRALYRKHVAAIVTWADTVTGPIALHMDANATEDFPLLAPLLEAGFVCMTAPSHGDRAIDQVWVRDARPEEVRAL